MESNRKSPRMLATGASSQVRLDPGDIDPPVRSALPNYSHTGSTLP